MAITKIRKGFAALARILRKPYLLNLILQDNEYWKERVSGKYGLAEGLPMVPFDTFVPLEARIEPYAFLDGSALLTDLALLRALAARQAPCRYFEIGTWRGESVANMAAVAGQCFTLDLPEEEMRRRNWEEAYIRQHGFFSKDLPNVSHLYGDSRTFDYAGLGAFDLIFIDGDHQYSAVKQDTENVFSHLVHNTTVVVWHDYAFHPEKVRYELLLAILDALPRDLHRFVYHVAHTKCAVFIREELEGAPLKWPVDPAQEWEVLLRRK